MLELSGVAAADAVTASWTVSLGNVLRACPRTPPRELVLSKWLSAAQQRPTATPGTVENWLGYALGGDSDVLLRMHSSAPPTANMPSIYGAIGRSCSPVDASPTDSSFDSSAGVRRRTRGDGYGQAEALRPAVRTPANATVAIRIRRLGVRIPSGAPPASVAP